MTWDMTVVGTVAVDDITTPTEHLSNLYGGSAIYAGLAAAKSTTVHLHGPVGEDEATNFRALFRDLPVNFDGFVPQPLPTHRWFATYDFETGIATETAVDLGCGAKWQPQLTQEARTAPVLLIGCIWPDRQLEVLRQTESRLIGIDSREDMIEGNREEINAAIRQADILFVNREELRALVPWRDTVLSSAAQSLLGQGRLRAVVVKAGADGAACVTAEGVAELPAYPVERVVDPTGAGDALAGGFLGACARMRRDDPGIFPAALDMGLRCAAAAIATFGVEGLASHHVHPVGSPIIT
jgi:sugar/nucleoside kinase (ribokinase family)